MHARHRFLMLPLAAALVATVLSACTAAPTADGGSTVEEQAPVEEPTGPSIVDPGPNAGATTGAGAWCALAPAELAEQTLGIQVQPPAPSFTSDEIRCSYRPVQEGGRSLQLRFRPDQDHASFVAYREAMVASQRDAVADLPGVGDEAFYSASEFDAAITNTVVARQSTIIVIVVAPATLDQTTALTTQVLAKLY